MDRMEDPPVKMGETYVVSINALGEKGDGIARVKGFVLFVAKVQKGGISNRTLNLRNGFVIRIKT